MANESNVFTSDHFKTFKLKPIDYLNFKTVLILLTLPKNYTIENNEFMK